MKMKNVERNEMTNEPTLMSCETLFESLPTFSKMYGMKNPHVLAQRFQIV